MDQLAGVGTEILHGSENLIDFDYVLSRVGDFGPYQIVFFFLICLPASLPSAFSAFNQPFVVGSPPHQCRLPSGRDDLKPQDADMELSKCFQYNQTQVDFYRSFTSLPIQSYSDEISLVPCQSGMEFMGKSGRIFSGLMISLFFGAAMALLGVVAMFIRSFLPESPRWLVSAGKWKEASIQLQRIAKMNGKKDQVNVEELLGALRENQDVGPDGEQHSHNVTDLFKTPNLRKKTVLVTYIWIMNAIIYNGLTLNISNLPVDDYWSFIINGAVELPAYFIVWPLLQTMGRRWTLAATMIVCGIGCVSAMFMPTSYPWLVASASFVGKFGVGSGFAVIYIFAGELYPTG
nr:Protein OCT-1, isoform a [Haemonchus contortus]